MKTVKNLIFSAILIVVIALNTTNIIIQLQTVEEAKKKNTDIKRQITALEEENHRLERKIEVATTSAYISAQMKDKLGLGTENDYWLILPEYGQNTDIVPQAESQKEIPNWKRWLMLLSKQEIVIQ